MDIKINIPNNVKMIIDKLKYAGHESVIIGGCVRDSIMGEIPHDWDIATSAQPEEIMECLDVYKRQSITAGEIYKDGNEWKFHAVGTGHSGGLMEFCEKYGIEVQ